MVSVVVAVVGGGRVWAASQDVETPEYKVEVAQGKFELRQYPPLVAAQVARQGKRGAAVAINPRTGETLALASNPPFAPHILSPGPVEPRGKHLPAVKRPNGLPHPPIHRQYPPASTF